MQSRKRTRLRPAEGWPKDWYYSGEFDTVNIEALLAPDEFFNRVILERKPNEKTPGPPSEKPAPRQARKPGFEDIHQTEAKTTGAYRSKRAVDKPRG